MNAVEEAISEEDRLLGELIASDLGPQALVGPLPWPRVVAMLRRAGYTVKKIADYTDDTPRGFSDLEKKARALLAQMAPAGTVPTAAQVEEIKLAIAGLVREELVEMGVSEKTAAALGSMLAAAVAVKRKA